GRGLPAEGYPEPRGEGPRASLLYVVERAPQDPPGLERSPPTRPRDKRYQGRPRRSPEERTAGPSVRALSRTRSAPVGRAATCDLSARGRPTPRHAAGP